MPLNVVISVLLSFQIKKHPFRCKYVRNHMRTVKELNVIVCYCSNPIDTISRASSFIYCCLFAKASKCKPTRQSFLLKLINLVLSFLRIIPQLVMYAIAGKRLLLSCADVPQCECSGLEPDVSLLYIHSHFIDFTCLCQRPKSDSDCLNV